MVEQWWRLCNLFMYVCDFNKWYTLCTLFRPILLLLCNGNLYVLVSIFPTVFGCHLALAVDSWPFPQCHSEPEKQSTTLDSLMTRPSLPAAYIHTVTHNYDLCHICWHKNNNNSPLFFFLLSLSSSLSFRAQLINLLAYYRLSKNNWLITFNFPNKVQGIWFVFYLQNYLPVLFSFSVRSQSCLRQAWKSMNNVTLTPPILYSSATTVMSLILIII